MTSERMEQLEKDLRDRGRSLIYFDPDDLRALLRLARLAPLLAAEVEAWRAYNQARLEAATRPRGIPGSDQVVIAAAGTMVGQSRATTDACLAVSGLTLEQIAKEVQSG